jgi:hypothetical protein
MVRKDQIHKPGPTVLLPSGRIGKKVATNRYGNAIYVGQDGKALCHHGETPSAIYGWTLREKRAAGLNGEGGKGGRPSVTQGATMAAAVNSCCRGDTLCDCTTTDGLNTEYNIQPGDLPKLPPGPSGLYYFLGRSDAPEIVQNKIPQRFAFKSREASGESSEVWIQVNGTVVCEHGNTRRVQAVLRNTDNHPETPYIPRANSTIVTCRCHTVVPRRRCSVILPPCKPRARNKKAIEQEGEEEDAITTSSETDIGADELAAMQREAANAAKEAAIERNARALEAAAEAEQRGPMSLPTAVIGAC